MQSSRALRQQLESLRAAGVTHLVRTTMAIPATIETKPNPEVAVAETVTQARPQRGVLLPVEPAPMPRVAKPAPTLPEPVPFQALDLPKPERVAQLQVLQQKVAKCRRCDELARTRTQTVFGVGNPEAKILFIGEAPGADEDKQGEPFVGRAGQLLNDIIKACHLQREDIYICNVLRCRPPGNRLPSPEEAGHCREYLDGQIAIVNPEYIVCWGSCAAQNLLGTTMPIGKLRGQFFQYGRAKVLCTYHPSYLLRNPAAKKDVWNDMKFLFQDQGIKL